MSESDIPRLASRASRAPYAIYAITKHGVAIGARLSRALPGSELLVSEKLFAGDLVARAHLEGARAIPLPLGPVLADAFVRYDCHVFVISVGAVVRLIAPLLQNKKVDPAVVCVDDAARFAICVLSGHVGRGNAFTERVATAIGAQPVVTTASDVGGTLTVDILGRELGWELDDADRNVTRGCAAVVNEGPVLVVQETGEPDFWPRDRPLPPGVRYTTSLGGVVPGAWEILLLVTDRDVRRSHPLCWENAVLYRPKSLVVGLGCDRGVSPDMVQRGVDTLLGESGLSPRSVKALATIDRKGDEEAFLVLSRERGWPLVTFRADELDQAPGIENPSEQVRRYVGTRGVAEPAALLAAGAERLLVTKRTYTEPGAGRSMTFAVARIPFEPRAGEKSP
jgi:cobalt-precorrin 5A hydrolase